MTNETYAAIASSMFPGAKLKAVVRLTGGVSADVHRLDLNLRGGSTTSLVLRAHGTSHSGHAAALEIQLLQALHRGGVPVPEPLHVDVSGDLLADPFLIMAFVDGTSAIPVGQEGPSWGNATPRCANRGRFRCRVRSARAGRTRASTMTPPP
jgi:aminoglycoside phosphotransferase (APT) family kinase protein